MSLALAPPAHLLVRLPNPLGDAVMAVPALRALRTALPETRITWCGGRAAHAALEGLPFRDGVMPAADKDARGRRAPMRAGRILAALGADAALLLPHSFSSALAVRRARIPVRVGSDLHGRRALLTHVVDLPKTDDGELVPRSMIDLYLDLVAPFGAAADGGGLALATTAFDEERAGLRLAALPAGLPIVAVNPGAAFGATKIYPPVRIAEVIAKVRAAAEVAIVLTCGPGEEDLAAAIAQRVGPPVVSCHEAVPDLGELKAILRRASLLLTTDTGPRHLAEAFGVSTVVWMGPTDPRWSGHSAGRVVRVERLDCLACHQKVCPIGLPCMLELDPSVVAAAALQALG